eukprot:1159063-Pelagomonas_calceolata.AAC.6
MFLGLECTRALTGQATQPDGTGSKCCEATAWLGFPFNTAQAGAFQVQPSKYSLSRSIWYRGKHMAKRIKFDQGASIWLRGLDLVKGQTIGKED